MFQCEKAKEILDMLNAGNGGVIAMSIARQEVEGLIPILTMEPHGVEQVQPSAVEEVEAPAVEEGQPEAMEEVPPEEAAAQTQDVEQPQGEQAQPQTEAEEMQEALI